MSKKMSSTVTSSSSLDIEKEVGRTLKVVPFDGSREEWHMWSRRFLSMARIRDVEKYFLEANACPVTPADGSGDFSEAEKVLFKHHNIAYGWLVMSVQCPTCFGLIDTARTPIHPKGSCYLAWKALKSKFEPKLVATTQQLKAQFHSKSMSRNQDPDEYIQELERIRQRLEEVGASILD